MAHPERVALRRLAWLGLLGLGCTMAPEEIRRIEVENELLRKEIQVIRENCDRYHYRDLELQVDDEEKEDSP